VPLAARLVLHLYGPIECRRCGARLAASAAGAAAGPAASMLFAVLALAALAHSLGAMLAVIAAGLPLRLWLALSQPLVALEGSDGEA
jgi:hypothetical protein